MNFGEFITIDYKVFQQIRLTQVEKGKRDRTFSDEALQQNLVLF